MTFNGEVVILRRRVAEMQGRAAKAKNAVRKVELALTDEVTDF